ncbi:Asp-tRNA(Asn)/Glu-tRNA(Gln) amidotransferase subunit GatC [Candidatus Saccharibacteria bacterium]|nr:Asp-tRNA(Asn)/Glu-tRNA(Gln) amidotransferase subunit GatC [Candidatus Saccharibacteria bacterium]
MADISRNDIVKLARLARLELSEAEIDEYVLEMSEIIGYVDLLQSVDVTGLKPTNQVTGLTNVTRLDEVVDYGYDLAALRSNVPGMQDDHIKVRRMIG